jgi:hypothetical protein
MGGILVKCSAGVGGVEEQQDQKIAAFGSSYRIAVGRGGYFAGEKKALLSKTFLNFGAEGDSSVPYKPWSVARDTRT